MRVLIVEDHAVVRAGLRQMLVASLGAEIAEAADAPAALAAVAACPPDIVVLDLGLPGTGGLALLPLLVAQGLRVVVLSMHAAPIFARRALEAGALGYVSKNVAPDELLTAVRRVAQGRRHIEPQIAEELALQGLATGDRLHRLSERDLEIMRLLAAGSSLTEIAARLGVSYKTAANIAGQIRMKLGVARTADLIRLALELQRQES
jgi:DNA-binding NarL/FixJ family response regulator